LALSSPYSLPTNSLLFDPERKNSGERHMTTTAKILELAGIAPGAMTVSPAQFDVAVALAYEQGKAAKTAKPANAGTTDEATAHLASDTAPAARLNAAVDRLIADQADAPTALGRPLGAIPGETSPALAMGLNAAIDRLVAGQSR
jgi:hypothetical protein